MSEENNAIGGIIGWIDKISRTKFVALLMAMTAAFFLANILYQQVTDSVIYHRQSINRLIKQVEEKSDKYDLCQKEMRDIQKEMIEQGRSEVKIVLEALNRSTKGQKELKEAINELKNAIQ